MADTSSSVTWKIPSRPSSSSEGRRAPASRPAAPLSERPARNGGCAVLGVVSRDAGGPRLAYLNERIPATPELLAQAAPADPARDIPARRAVRAVEVRPLRRRSLPARNAHRRDAAGGAVETAALHDPADLPMVSAGRTGGLLSLPAGRYVQSAGRRAHETRRGCSRPLPGRMVSSLRAGRGAACGGALAMSGHRSCSCELHNPIYRPIYQPIDRPYQRPSQSLANLKLQALAPRSNPIAPKFGTRALDTQQFHKPSTTAHRR